MNNNFLTELTKSIISINDLSGNIIAYTNVEIKEFTDDKSPYKNYKSIGCFIDGKKISIRNKKVTYRCSCGAINTIFFKKFIIKTRLCCPQCKELDVTKRRNHSLFF